MEQLPSATRLDGTPASCWADNGGTALHYLDVRRSAPGPAVLVLPGFGEEAADHLSLLDAVAPRRAIAVDLRGRGPSTAAAQRYRLEDHVADLQAIAKASELERPHLVTYSRGTTYGLAWALGGGGRVASITIGDYPPAQIVPPPGMPEMAAKRIWRNRPMTDRMSPDAIAAMVADAVAVDFWGGLAELAVPMLLIRGDGAGMVDDAVEARYRRTVADLRVITFEGSGHDLWSPDPDRFAATVASFLDEVDARVRGAAR